MRIFKVGTSTMNRIRFQLKLWKIFFSFSWDKNGVSLCVGPIGIRQEWWEKWNIFPRKSNYFSESANTFKGRLRRFIRWEQDYH